ncbi:MAG: cation:proton antiporter [Deltaproteobacteria bacterium]|nr:cation:proton antiporter [Deltaproteobacteria bacterium]
MTDAFKIAITPALIIDLLLILTIAWVLGGLFLRFGLPVMLGELLAGVIIGPAGLGWIRASEPLALLAELGIFFAMFYAGMEMDPKQLVEHLRPSVVVALGGFIVPFGLGFMTIKLFGGTVYQALFVGMGLSVTAIAVQAVVLENMRILNTKIGHVIIGAAIVDDILSLVALSVLLGVAKSGTMGLVPLLVILLKVAVFFAVTLAAGHFLVPGISRRLGDYHAKGFTFALVVALIMAYLVELVGLHLIIGAFLAGQFVRKEIMDEAIYRKIRDRFFAASYGFLTPIFFVTLSFHLRLQWDLSFILLIAVITVIAIIGKLAGCGLGAVSSGYNAHQAMIIGFGMNGRGAVELVVAAVVMQLSQQLLAARVITEPLLTENQFSGLVVMAFITTVLAPISLKWAVGKACGRDENEAFCTLWKRAISE